jgi:hypothetical protein
VSWLQILVFFAVICPITWLVYLVQELVNPKRQAQRIASLVAHAARLCSPCLVLFFDVVVAQVVVWSIRFWLLLESLVVGSVEVLSEVRAGLRRLVLWMFPECADCGRGWAKPCTGGRCNSCFFTALFQPCPICERGWRKPMTGLCNTCFRLKIRRDLFPPCPDCGRGWSKPGTGLCNTCFRRRARQTLQRLWG